MTPHVMKQPSCSVSGVVLSVWQRPRAVVHMADTWTVNRTSGAGTAEFKQNKTHTQKKTYTPTIDSMPS